MSKSKTRRSLKKNILTNNKFTIFGTNCNGVLQKYDSLIKNVDLYKPGVIFLQETKVKRKGQIKIENYQTFEIIRTENNGGGLLLAAHFNLEPVLVADHQDKGHEILTIEAKFGQKYCRFINAYGPQESTSLETQKHNSEFFGLLDQEIKNAQLLGHLVCLQLDDYSAIYGID